MDTEQPDSLPGPHDLLRATIARLSLFLKFEKKILAISNMSDQASFGPKTVITGPVWDMYPTVSQAIKLVAAGVYTAQDYGDFSRMGKGGSYLAPYHEFDKTLPADVKELVEKKKAEILEGNFRVDVDEGTPVSD